MKTAAWREIPCPTCGAKVGKCCLKRDRLTQKLVRQTNAHAERRMACRTLTPDRVAAVCDTVSQSTDRFARAESLRMRGEALIRRALG